MDQQQLSPKAQAAFHSLNNLPPAERQQVLALASQINDAASAATPEPLAEALSSSSGSTTPVVTVVRCLVPRLRNQKNNLMK